MNKKLMAVAVAGALAAPGLALAQATVYGSLNVEYGFVSQAEGAGGASRPNADAFNSGASYIGFRGEEKLGGGMSAWFQCESQDVFASTTTTGALWCGRNSQQVERVRVLRRQGKHLLVKGFCFPQVPGTVAPQPALDQTPDPGMSLAHGTGPFRRRIRLAQRCTLNITIVH